jgi:hypothetical protein
VANKPGTADALEKHNRDVLILEAQAKLAAGKKLTRQQITAVEAAEAEKRKAHDLPYMEAMPKGEFVERFGGTFLVYINWRKRYGFPWPEDRSATVNVLEVLKWFRDWLAANPNQTLEGQAAADDRPADASDRLHAAKAQMAELQLKTMLGDYVHVDDARADQSQLWSTFRGFVETLPRKHQDEWAERVAELGVEWGVVVDARTTDGGRPAKAPPPRVGKPNTKADAKPRGIRGAVRKTRNGTPSG